MIPKIVHICWLSGDEFPPEIKVCLESWKNIIPDYTIWLWGKKPKDCLGLDVVEKPFDLDSVLWTKQAFDEKKYAFAADYIRLFAIYNYGGIYMDSDVMMYKSFNNLLSLPYFIGEDFVHCFEPAIFGAEKGCKWVKDVLDRYTDLPFVGADGALNLLALPIVFHQRLANYRFEYSKSVEPYNYKEDVIRIFPSNFFNSRNYIKPIKTADSYCSHHFIGSWLKKTKSGFDWKTFIPDPIVNLVYSFAYNVLFKSSIKERQIQFIN